MRISADGASMANAVLRHWQENQRVLSASVERISTGTTMNRPVDDAAGVAIAERMRARLESSLQAQRNAQDGISVVDMADGALSSMTALIQQMRVLAVQSANGTFDDTSRGYLQSGVVHTLDELDAIAERTRVAGRSILKGTGLTFHVGPDAADSRALNFARSDRDGLGVGGIDISTQEGATSALDVLDAAIQQLVEQRALAAAAHQQFERISTELARSGLDHAMALSRTADVDIAHEAVQVAQAQLLTDVAAALMVQVTAVQRSVLDLLRPLDLPAEPPGDTAAQGPVSTPAAGTHVITGPVAMPTAIPVAATVARAPARDEAVVGAPGRSGPERSTASVARASSEPNLHNRPAPIGDETGHAASGSSRVTAPGHGAAGNAHPHLG